MASPRTQNRTIPPAAGIRAGIKDKARNRRETHTALTAIKHDASPPRNDLLPDLHIEYVAIESLTSAPRRVRRSEAKQAARIERSIARHGICAPILVNGERQVVHGHGVLEAAKRFGLREVPIIAITHLTRSEERTLALALNRLGETGEWDEELLRLELAELIELDEDIISTGFELAEVDALLLEDDGSEAEEVPTLPVIAVSAHGDLWMLGDHLLLQGDALDSASYERLVGPGTVRLVLTDVPYNVPVTGHVTGQSHHREFAMAHGEMSREEFAAFNGTWMQFALASLMAGGLLASFIDWRSVEIILAAGRELGLDLLNMIVWAKSNGGQGSLWRSQHELLPVFKKPGAPHVNNVKLGASGRWRSNLWTYAGGSSLGSDARDGLADHPTVKPKAMLEDALLDITNRGDIVLDPFLGSGSTLLAAESTGRVCRGIEIDGAYCDVAIKRWERLTGLEATLVETGETHERVAQRRCVPDDEGRR